MAVLNTSDSGINYVDLFINQGADWSVGMNLNNDDGSSVNVTGYQFIGAMRTSYSSANVVANLTVTIINSVAGNTMVSMNSATTSNISAGKYVYDVVMIDTSNNVTRVMEGVLTIRPGVTIT